MTTEEQIQYWIDIAENDVPVAKSLLANGHYMYCLFIGHLILEKIIKAHYVKDTKQTPPKIHNLVKLISKTVINPNASLLEFLDEANDFQMEARYPDFKINAYRTFNKMFTEEKFAKILEVYEWLKSQLK